MSFLTYGNFYLFSQKGESALTLAAIYSSVGVAELLIEKGTEVNETNQVIHPS